MKNFLLNFFGYNTVQGDIVHYPDGRLLVSHTVTPDKEYSFNDVFQRIDRELATKQ